MSTKNPESLTGPTLHNLDWGNARDKAETPIAVALMMAANEFYSQQYLGQLLQQDQNDEKTLLMDLAQDAAFSHLIRFQAALVNEVYVTFIETLGQKDNADRRKVIEDFHARHTEVSDLYEKLKAQLTGQNFDGLVKVRNNISFHFNYSKNAAIVAKAFNDKLDEMIAGKHSLSLPVKQQGKCPGASRYVFADGVTNKAWRTLWGIKATFKSREEADKDARLNEMSKYLNESANLFLEWADSFIKCWADEYKLFTNSEDYSAVKARGERAIEPYSF